MWDWARCKIQQQLTELVTIDFVILRAQLSVRIEQALARGRVVLLTGARQVGKTTLARQFVDPASENYFDLENPADLARLESPMTALERLEGTVVIDEVQRGPDIFPILRVLSDRHPLPAKFLILGSAAPEALHQASESLTGRIEVIEIHGLSLEEVGIGAIDDLWLRGGFPLAFSAERDSDSYAWRQQYVRNLANRDLPEFGMRLGAATLERFLGIVAAYHGQIWNSAAPARAIGISEASCRRYIDALADALLVRIVRPWTGNLGKRVVKSPKIYFRDSGLLHALLGISDRASLQRHIGVGASWEGFAIQEAINASDSLANPYFWRTRGGAEVDLILERRGLLIGVEVKRADAPKATRSMTTAVEDLDLARLLVVYPGRRRYALTERIEAVPLSGLADALVDVT